MMAELLNLRGQRDEIDRRIAKAEEHLRNLATGSDVAAPEVLPTRSIPDSVVREVEASIPVMTPRTIESLPGHGKLQKAILSVMLRTGRQMAVDEISRAVGSPEENVKWILQSTASRKGWLYHPARGLWAINPNYQDAVREYVKSAWEAIFGD